MQPTRSEIIALVVALAPFVVYFGASGTQTVNGQITSYYNYNYAGIVLGVVAIGLAIRAVSRLPEEAPSQPRALHLAVAAGIAVLAVYQIARGASLLA
jgi:hypothetical protein